VNHDDVILLVGALEVVGAALKGIGSAIVFAAVLRVIFNK